MALLSPAEGLVDKTEKVTTLRNGRNHGAVPLVAMIVGQPDTVNCVLVGKRRAQCLRLHGGSKPS